MTRPPPPHAPSHPSKPSIMSVVQIQAVLVSAVTLAFPAADQTRAMQDQMSGSAMMAPPDPMKAFKAEWEALEICSHEWALEGVEEELTGGIIQPETIYIKNKFA